MVGPQGRRPRTTARRRPPRWPGRCCGDRGPRGGGRGQRLAHPQAPPRLPHGLAGGGGGHLPRTTRLDPDAQADRGRPCGRGVGAAGLGGSAGGRRPGLAVPGERADGGGDAGAQRHALLRLPGQGQGCRQATAPHRICRADQGNRLRLRGVHTRAKVAPARRLGVVLHCMWVDGGAFRWTGDGAGVAAAA